MPNPGKYIFLNSVFNALICMYEFLVKILYWNPTISRAEIDFKCWYTS